MAMYTLKWGQSQIHSRSRRTPTSARAGARRPISNRCAPIALSNKGNKGKEWTPANCMAVVPHARSIATRGAAHVRARAGARHRRLAAAAAAAAARRDQRLRLARGRRAAVGGRNRCRRGRGRGLARHSLAIGAVRQRDRAPRGPALRRLGALALAAPAARTAGSCGSDRLGSGGMRVPCWQPLRLRARWPRAAHLRQSLSAARAPPLHSWARRQTTKKATGAQKLRSLERLERRGALGRAAARQPGGSWHDTRRDHRTG